MRMISLRQLMVCLTLCGCTHRDVAPTPAGQTRLKVGASAVPHQSILQKAAEVLARQNIKLQIITFNDYVQPNLRLAEGDLDANYYQTQPYLDAFNAQHHLSLISLGRVHVEPFGLYSRRHKSLQALPEQAWVAIPNEVSNGHRALALLERAGLIKLNPAPGLSGGIKDIVFNPRHLRFKEVEAAMMPRVLSDVDVAGVNTNYALSAGLIPAKDSLALETGDSPYANILVGHAKDKERPALKVLLQALHDPEVVAFIHDKYAGSVISAP